MYITTKIKISENDYNKLLQRSKEEIEDYVLNVAYKSPFNPCGYGFDYPSIFKEDDICYASWKHWDSCD